MKDYLVCIDSDGCAMDSMEIKHRQCFGPCIVDVWQLGPWKEEILNHWNIMNLYSMTRGINRFLGLERMLSEIDEKYCSIAGIKDYKNWCDRTEIYSNDSIKDEIKKGNHPIFSKVLEWSQKVNRSVEVIYDNLRPFKNVKETLEMMHKYADIAIVSSANPQAVREEWTRFKLMEWVDYVMAQDAGTKAQCIKTLLSNGYDRKCVLMIGDAPGDLRAAKENQVAFYPILAGKENICWEQLFKQGFHDFITGKISDKQKIDLEKSFIQNLQRQ